MAQYPAMPLFTDAYMADTRHLTAAQHGAYLLMLMTAWRMPDCRLPNEDKFLSRICGMDMRTWKANKSTILEFWLIDGDAKLYQKRLEDERKYVAQLVSKKSAAGKASALKRKNRHSTGAATEGQQDGSTHTHTHIKKDNTNVLSKENKKPTLDELSLHHINDWLMKKHVQGIFTGIDEELLLEKFKDYCIAKDVTYKDYVAAFRNAFQWKEAPRKKGFEHETRPYNYKGSKSDRAKDAINRGMQ